MLAAASTPRGSERHSATQDPGQHSATASSFKSPKSTNDGRNSTPSISPLSSTSRHHNDSVNEDVKPQTSVLKSMETNVVNNEVANGRRERSSSLSDIEGDLEEQEQEQDQEEEEEQSASEDGLTPLGDENESEAETERIKPTPRKEGQTTKIAARGAHGSAGEVDGSDVDSIGTQEDAGNSRASRSLAGRKRKRPAPRNASSFAQSDDSDSDEALAERSKQKKSAANASLQANLNGGGRVDRDLQGENVSAQVEVMAAPQTVSPTKSHKRGKGKSHAAGKSHKKRVDQAVVEEEGGDEDDQDEDEDEEATATIDPAELVRREQAMSNFRVLAEQFSALRSSIHGERIAEAENELAMLQQAHPVHAEYIKQLQAVTARRDVKIQQEMRLHQYKKQTLRTSTLASRAQLLSQYMQDAREARERILYELGQQWYDIQKERRTMQAEEVANYETTFPTKHSARIRHQTKYNAEVSILSGFAKYVGFPAAPAISGIGSSELGEDMRSIRSKMPQKNGINPVSTSKFGGPAFGSMPTPTMESKSDHIAQKEFLEQTPWANPRHPVHAQSRTPSAFGHHQGVPGRADHSSPGFSALGRTASAFATPHTGMDRVPGSEQRAPGSNDTVGPPSDPPSSVQPAPPTADRIRLLPQGYVGDASPTSYVKRGPPSGKRDFSGLSSASTIDAPADGAIPGEGRTPGPSSDVSLPNQTATATALHRT